MKLLIIDTATEACSVALELEGRVYHRFEFCPQQHSQRILPMIDEVLQEAGLKLKELDYLGFGQGPGSFTGVRIATGILQGLALGAGRHVVGISTLAAMAQQAISEEGAIDVNCAIDARMSEIYFGHYQNQKGLATLVREEQVLAPSDAMHLLVNTENSFAVGTGWQAYPELLAGAGFRVTDTILYPNARYMLPLMKKAIEQGLTREIESVQPVYLRDKVTWKKLPGRE